MSCNGVEQTSFNPSMILGLAAFPKNVSMRAEKVKRPNRRPGLSLLQNLWYSRRFVQNIIDGIVHSNSNHS